MLQFKLPGVTAEAVGGVLFKATVAEAVEVQPFKVSVTTRLYMPASLTVGFCKLELKLFGPAQAKIAAVSSVAPVMTTLSITQVSVFPTADAPGALVLDVTLAVAVLVQVVILSVTTTL